MYTAMAVVALTLSVPSGNTSPTWLDDYKVARARVADDGKPMVVVISSGQAGWQKVVRDGGFDPAVARLLADKFVCLYADTTTATGRQLANALQVRQGVVISDKSGRSQAFSASGTVSRGELMSALVRYSDRVEVARTEVQTTTTPAGSVPAGTVIQGGPGTTVIQGGTAMPARTVVTPGAPMYVAPAPGAPVMGGSAAGCCPTGGYGGGYGMGGCCGGGGGYARGGCGGGGHKCCGMCGGMFGGGGWGGGWGGGGCGGGYGGGGCGGGKFGGMFGGWGGGYGGGGCCH